MSEQDSIATYFASPEFADALASAIERRVSLALTPLDTRVSALEASLLSLTSHVRTVAPFASAPAKASKGAKGKAAKAVKATAPAVSVAPVALSAQIQALAGTGYEAGQWAVVRDAMRAAGMPKSDANRNAASFLRGTYMPADPSAPAQERPAASVAAPAKPVSTTVSERFLTAELIEPKAQARATQARKTPNPVLSVKTWLAAVNDRADLPEGDDDRLSPNTVAQYRAVAKRALEILAA